MAQRDINFSIPANSGINLAVKGDFIYLKSASADVLVLVNDQAISMSAGDTQNVTKYEIRKFTDPDTRERIPYVVNVGFTDIRVENETGTTITGVIVAGNGGYEKAIALGNVSASLPDSYTIGSKARVDSDKSFYGSAGISGHANYGTTQLWNPAGSGKILRVTDIIASSSGTSPVLMQPSVVAITNSIHWEYNKQTGGGAVGQLRNVNTATLLGLSSSVTLYNAANNPIRLGFTDPLKLPEGNGITVQNGTVGIGIYVAFEWTEEDS